MHAPALLRPELAADADQVERLVAAAFGPGRLAKSAERVREGSPFDLALSFVAEVGGQIVGTVRLTAVRVGEEPAAVFLGPIAVDPAQRGQGLGKALVETAVQAAASAGKRLVVLVGDPAVFDSMGFSNRHTKHVHMPGPVDQRRVMARALAVGADENLSGLIAPI